MTFFIPNAGSATFPAQAVPDATDITSLGAADQSSGSLPSQLDGLSTLVVSSEVLSDMTVIVQNTTQAQVHLTTGLTNGQTGVVSLAISALQQAVTNGDSILLSGPNGRQTVTASASAVVGATSITTTSFTASVAFPVTTTQVMDTSSWIIGSIVLNSTINAVKTTVLTVGAASTNDRKDIVVWTSGGTGFQVVAGTPCSVGNWTAASGVAPPVKATIPANSVLLAEIYVAGSSGTATTALTSSNIIDKSSVVGGGLVAMTNAGTSSGTTFGAAITVLDATTGTGNMIQTYDKNGQPILSSTRVGGILVSGDVVRSGPVAGPWVELDGANTVPPALSFTGAGRIWMGAVSPFIGITSGTPAVNDLYYDWGSARWYVCTAGGTPGSWNNMSGLSNRDNYQGLQPFGTAIETIPRSQLNLATGTLTSGTLLMSAVSLQKGMVIANLGWVSGTTAGSALTHQWLGLYNSSRVQLAVTADKTSTAIAASTNYNWPIATIAGGASGTFTTTYAGLHYIGLLVTSSTTQPNVSAFTTIAGANGLAPILSGNSDTAQTTPPAFAHTAGAITAGTIIPYFICY